MLGLPAIGGLFGGGAGGLMGGGGSADSSSAAATLGDFGGGDFIVGADSRGVPWLALALAGAAVLAIYLIKRK